MPSYLDFLREYAEQNPNLDLIWLDSQVEGYLGLFSNYPLTDNNDDLYGSTNVICVACDL